MVPIDPTSKFRLRDSIFKSKFIFISASSLQTIFFKENKKERKTLTVGWSLRAIEKESDWFRVINPKLL